MEPPTSSWAQGVADWPLIPAPSPCAGVDATRGRATDGKRRRRRRRRRRLPRRFRGRLRRTASWVAAAVTTATSALPRPLVALAWSANCACGLRSLQGARSRQIYIYTISSVLRLSATLVCVIDCLQKGLVHSYVINDKPHVSHTGAPKAKRAQHATRTSD